jgi:hypothetical protein
VAATLRPLCDVVGCGVQFSLRETMLYFRLLGAGLVTRQGVVVGWESKKHAAPERTILGARVSRCARR